MKMTLVAILLVLSEAGVPGRVEGAVLTPPGDDC